MQPSYSDHVEITQLLAEYCLALDHDDADRWVAVFTPDCAFEVYGRSFDGHDGLRKMMRVAPGGLHLGGPPVIEMVDDDRARTEQNLLFVERGTQQLRSAVYYDDLVRTDAGWRIARRHCTFIVRDGLRDRPDE